MELAGSDIFAKRQLKSLIPLQKLSIKLGLNKN